MELVHRVPGALSWAAGTHHLPWHMGRLKYIRQFKSCISVTQKCQLGFGDRKYVLEKLSAEINLFDVEEV